MAVPSNRTFYYREGEVFVRELARFLDHSGAEGSPVEVRVAAEFVTATNRQVRARQLWGTDVYTEDSDLVACLVHTGFYKLTSASAPLGLIELRATLRPVAGQPAYLSTLRHGIRSRAWGGGATRPGGYPPCAFRVEKCSAVVTGGAVAVLDPASAPRTPTHTFALAPGERAAAAAAAHPPGRGGGPPPQAEPEVTLQYNLCNEPWLKYSLGAVADRGLQRSGWTSVRLRTAVLLLESHSARYELAWEEEGDDCPPGVADEGVDGDTYRFSRCASLLTADDMHASGLPLPDEAVHVIARGVPWEGVLWGASSVAVGGVTYPVSRLLFLPRTPAAAA